MTEIDRSCSNCSKIRYYLINQLPDKHNVRCVLKEIAEQLEKAKTFTFNQGIIQNMKQEITSNCDNPTEFSPQLTPIKT